MTALAEAWLLAFLLAATLGAGALAILATGLLMRERWVEPLSPRLYPAVRALPALLLLALPLPFLAGTLYPWAGTRRGWVVPLAGLVILLLWSGLGRRLARPRASRTEAGVTLLLLILSAAIGFEDWGLSRDTEWTGSLYGIALLVGGAVAALSLAILLGPPSAEEEPEARTGLERALLALGIASLWLWFVQFITVWAADLPPEAAWYLRRQEGLWFWAKAGVALPALLLALLLAIVPIWRPWRMRVVAALFLVQHLVLVAWIVRPDAALAPGAATGRPSPLADAIVIVLSAILLLLAARLAGRRAPEPV